MFGDCAKQPSLNSLISLNSLNSLTTNRKIWVVWHLAEQLISIIDRKALLLELLAHKPAGEVAADIVAHDGPEPSAEHRHLELVKNEC